MKITRFADIRPFTSGGNWQANYDLAGAVRTINEWMNETLGPLNIDPDFQRLHVWTEDQQIAWIEFFLRGGKSGLDIYFNHPGWRSNYKGEFVLVDGKQRIKAAMRFINNEIPAFGSYYREFTDRIGFTDTTLVFHVNNLKTRAEVLQWYLEFNTGGTPHSAEEIAKAQRLLDEELLSK